MSEQSLSPLCLPSVPYVGRAGGREMSAELRRLGMGELLQPGEFPPTRFPYALDNGAYRAYSRKEPWNAMAFERTLTHADEYDDDPSFIVAPDIVAGGLKSLARSIEWFDRCKRVGRVYLAVQDDMTTAHVSQALDDCPFSGIFVGGTTDWKRSTGKFWVEFAHERGMQCHVARTGTTRAVEWARAIGADSLDSSLPIWSRTNLERFVKGLRNNLLPIAEPIRPPELPAIKVRETLYKRFAPRPIIDDLSMQLAFEFTMQLAFEFMTDRNLLST